MTAEALREHGLPPRITAAGSAEALLEKLPRNLAGWRVVFPCGDDAAEELPAELRARGARVERLVVYRKIPRPHDPELDREILEEPFAAFCTTSPSAARWLFEGLSPEAAARLRADRRRRSRDRPRAGTSKSSASSGSRSRPTPSFSEALRLLEYLATGPQAA